MSGLTLQNPRRLRQQVRRNLPTNRWGGDRTFRMRAWRAPHNWLCSTAIAHRRWIMPGAPRKLLRAIRNYGSSWDMQRD